MSYFDYCRTRGKGLIIIGHRLFMKHWQVFYMFLISQWCYTFNYLHFNHGKTEILEGLLSFPKINQLINDKNRIQAQVFVIKTHSLSVPPLCKFIFLLSSLMRVNNIHKLFFKIESKHNDVAIRTCVATASKITFVRSYNHFQVKCIHILSE